jgi:hypothetical protein
MAMNPEPLFYIARAEDEVAGPYDVVQLAHLLRRKIITGETMTRLEGTDEWKPFSWHPQFTVARELPPDAVSTRSIQMDEAVREAKSGPIPLPSAETVLKLVGLFCGTVVAFLAALLVGWLDTTTGVCLMIIGCGAITVAQCMIMARLLQESYWTLGLTMFVPGGDIYYFLSNIWEYFTWFCVKYVGVAVLLGAAIGIGLHSAH